MFIKPQHFLKLLRMGILCNYFHQTALIEN